MGKSMSQIAREDKRMMAHHKKNFILTPPGNEKRKEIVTADYWGAEGRLNDIWKRGGKGRKRKLICQGN